MFKIVRKSVITGYKDEIRSLKTRLKIAMDAVSRLEETAQPRYEELRKLQEALREEKKRRVLAEASVEALENHLRILNSIKK